MKKLTKTTALILSALMLFGCTSNSANGSVGDTTPPSESSGTESESRNDSSATESSVTDSSSISGNSGEENNENLVKNIEGYQTFSYDKDKYVKTTLRKAYGNKKRDPMGQFTGETVTLPLARNTVDDEVLVIKCKVAGDSYVFQNGRSGIKTVQDFSEDNILNGVYTPVVIEEVIDKTTDAVSDLKAGDVIYIEEGFHVCEFIDENGNTILMSADEDIKNKKEEIAEYEKYIDEEKANKIPDEETLKEYEINIAQTKILIEECNAFNNFVRENNGKVVFADSGSPMEKEVSYLAFVAVTPVPGTNDGNSYHKAYPMKYDLACDDVPSLFGDDDIYFQGLYGYEKSWKAMKSWYGDHFKS